MPDDEVDTQARLHGRIEQLEQALLAARGRHAAAEADARRYRLFLDSVLDYAFITFDPYLHVVGWSAGAERILGYAEAEALGLSSGAFFTPEDLMLNMEVREARTADEVGSAEDERWHMRRDGSRFWASGVMTLLRDEAGAPVGYIKVMRDNTARRLAEQAVRHSEERLRLYTENVRDYALVPVDPAGAITGWNTGASRIFGYAEEEVLGRDVELFFTPEDQARGQSARDLQRALVEGRAEDERWMVRRDGTRFWSRWVTTPMYDSEGQLRGFAKVLHDETVRKQAEDTRDELRERESQSLRPSGGGDR